MLGYLSGPGERQLLPTGQTAFPERLETWFGDLPFIKAKSFAWLIETASRYLFVPSLRCARLFQGRFKLHPTSPSSKL
jgi:hypothetical protein